MRASKKVLEKAAKRKKDKYLEACRERRRDFIPMAYSVDGLAGKEARAAEKRLASLLASKWDRPYSEMACFVKTRMSLSIVRSISMLLRGSRSSAWKRRAPDDGVAARASVTSQRPVQGPERVVARRRSKSLMSSSLFNASRPSKTRRIWIPFTSRATDGGARAPSIYVGREPDAATSIPDGAADVKFNIPAAEKKAKKREDSDVRDKENAQKRARRAEDGEYRDALHARENAQKRARRAEDGEYRDALHARENAQKQTRRAEDGEYRDALQVRDVNRKRTAYNILIFLTSPARSTTCQDIRGIKPLNTTNLRSHTVRDSRNDLALRNARLPGHAQHTDTVQWMDTQQIDGQHATNEWTHATDGHAAEGHATDGHATDGHAAAVQTPTVHAVLARAAASLADRVS
ncbi:hypothetical protein THAOC_12663, partial [Thalassiosira oceanica]